ncbi:MAG: PAS domain S-box protein [Candidatus Omnitrophota bacterium]
MKLEFKLSLTATVIIVVLAMALEFSSNHIFQKSIHSNVEKLLVTKLDRLVAEATEQDELFFEDFYPDVAIGQARFIDKLRIGYRNDKDLVSYSFIIDNSGSVILHPQEQRGYQFFGRDIVSDMVKQQYGRLEYTHRGVRRHFLYKIFKPWGWIFLETTTEDFLNQPLYLFTGTLFGVSLFMIILSSLVILWSTRMYIRPLYHVIENLGDIARGRFSSPVEIKASGEMKMLVDSFNKMANDLRETAQKLNDERERLNVTLRSIGDGVIATDVEARVVLMNKVAEDLTGWSQQEALHQPLQKVFNIINQQTREPCENPVEKAIRANTIISLENNTVLVSRNGVERIIADSGSPIKDDRGTILGVVLVFRDNTDRIMAEQELRKLSLAVECSPSGILLTDTQGIVEYVNPLFTQMTGYAAEEILKTKARILRPDKLPAEKHGELWKALSAGETWSGEFENKRKNEEAYWEMVFVSPVKNNHGEIINFLIITQEITQRKLFEQKLEEEKKTLGIFHKAAVVQELDAIALKREVNEILAKNGHPIKYPEIDEIDRL